MPHFKPIHYANAGPEVRAVYDEIKATRGVDDINNFWKHVANHPPTLKHAWESVKEAMAPGTLDSLFKAWQSAPATAASIAYAATPTLLANRV